MIDAVKAAAMAKVRRVSGPWPWSRNSPRTRLSPKASKRPWCETTEKVVAIGASTGGTEALRVYLRITAGGRAGNRHRSAYAGTIHGRLRQAVGQPVPGHGQGGGRGRRRHSGEGSSGPRQPAPAAQTRGSKVCGADQGRPAGVAPSAFRGCSVSFCGPVRRAETRWASS